MRRFRPHTKTREFVHFKWPDEYIVALQADVDRQITVDQGDTVKSGWNIFARIFLVFGLCGLGACGGGGIAEQSSANESTSFGSESNPPVSSVPSTLTPNAPSPPPTPALASGSPDHAFGVKGTVTHLWDKITFPYGTGVIQQPDGKVVILGAESIGTNQRSVVAMRFNASGEPDPTFGIAGTATVFVSSSLSLRPAHMALQADGKIIVVAHETQLGNSDLRIYRLHPDGALDADWGDRGNAINAPARQDVAYGVLVQPDQKIIVLSLRLMARYLPNGDLDPSFGVNGIVDETADDGRIYAYHHIAMRGDGSIVLAGNIHAPGHSPYHMAGLIARYDRYGTLDTTYGSAGRVQIDRANVGDFFVAEDGTVYAGTSDAYLNRLDPNGTLDRSFGNYGNLELNATHLSKLRQVANNRLLALASPTNLGARHLKIMRLQLNGEPDAAFGEKGSIFLTYDHEVSAHALLIRPDGKILVVTSSNNDLQGSYVLKFNQFLP